MSRLEELIEELCPNGVEYKALGDCCSVLDNLRKPVSKSARVKGDYPYYGANGIQDYVAEYLFDGEFVLVGEDGSVLTKNGNPVVTWATGKIWVNNHAHIIKEVDNISLRYLFHFLQTINISHLVRGNIPKLTGRDFKQLPIPLPPLEIQQEIVRILDTMTNLTAELTAELTARKKQYEYYRDMLLKNQSEYPIKTLGETCKFVRGPFGGSLKKECFISEGFAVYEQQNAIYDNTNIRYYVNEEKFNELKRFEVKPGDLIMSCSGTMGKISIIPDEAPTGIINQALLKLTPNKGVSNKYLKYCFENTITDILNDNSRGGAIKNVASVAILKEIPIPVPPLETQQKIVDILDRFDVYCNDITKGLPAEIEARQKQYEYYRNKLLTFKEL